MNPAYNEPPFIVKAQIVLEHSKIKLQFRNSELALIRNVFTTQGYHCGLCFQTLIG